MQLSAPSGAEFFGCVRQGGSSAGDCGLKEARWQSAGLTNREADARRRIGDVVAQFAKAQELHGAVRRKSDGLSVKMVARQPAVLRA